MPLLPTEPTLIPHGAYLRNVARATDVTLDGLPPVPYLSRPILHSDMPRDRTLPDHTYNTSPRMDCGVGVQLMTNAPHFPILLHCSLYQTIIQLIGEMENENRLQTRPTPNHLARVALNVNFRLSFNGSFGFHRVKGLLNPHTRQKLYSQQFPSTEVLSKYANKFGPRNYLGNTPHTQRNRLTHRGTWHRNNNKKNPTGLSPDGRGTKQDGQPEKRP